MTHPSMDTSPMAVTAGIDIDQVFPRPGPRRVELVLPFPPSVNRIWKIVGSLHHRRRRVIRDPDYESWLNTCDGYVLEQIGVRTYRQSIKGRYNLTLTLCSSRFGRIDQDNCVKAVSDFLQRSHIIENDRWAWRTVIEWGDIDNSHEGQRLCHVAVDGIL